MELKFFFISFLGQLSLEQSQEGQDFRANMNKKFKKLLAEVIMLELQNSPFKVLSFQAFSESPYTVHFFNPYIGFYIDVNNSRNAVFSMG